MFLDSEKNHSISQWLYYHKENDIALSTETMTYQSPVRQRHYLVALLGESIKATHLYLEGPMVLDLYSSIPV